MKDEVVTFVTLESFAGPRFVIQAVTFILHPSAFIL
jgi:hypothetical protein